MTPAPEYPVLGSEQIYQGKIISVRRDTLQMEHGDTAEREIVAHPGAVVVVAVDDDENVVMVNQYRPALGRRLDELPAGLLDVAGEPAVLAARRELAEEASVQAGRWEVLLDLNTSPGFSDEAIRVYLARDLTDAGDPDGFVRAHEELTLRVTRVPLRRAVYRVLAGEITNAAAVAGILAADVARNAGWAGLRPVEAPWPDRPGAVG